MTKNWYTVKSEIYDEINRYRSERWKNDPGLSDYINRAITKSEDFSSNMRKELIIFVIAKSLHIMGAPLPSNKEDKQEKLNKNQIYYDLFEHFKFSLNTPIGNLMYPLSFVSNSSYTSSQDKRDVSSQIELGFEQLELVKKFPEYKEVFENIPKELFFKNVNIDNLRKEVAVKNGLKRLAKEFPQFSEDILKVKDEFSLKALKSIKELRVESEYSKVLSFLNEVYDEEAIQMVNEFVVNTASYSYLKNQPSIKKLIKLYPKAENVFSRFLNYKKDVQEASMFIESDRNYIYMPFTINLEALEAKLWKEHKLSRQDLAETFSSFCRVWKKQGETVFKYFLSDIRKGQNTEIELIFKIDKDELSISLENLNKFIKETLTEYLNLSATMKNALDYPLQEKFDKLEMQSDLVASKNNAISSKVKKF